MPLRVNVLHERRTRDVEETLMLHTLPFECRVPSIFDLIWEIANDICDRYHVGESQVVMLDRGLAANGLEVGADLLLTA